MHILYSLLIFALLGTFVIAEEPSNDLETERVKRVAVSVDDVDFDQNERPIQRQRQSKSRTRANDQNDATPITGSSALVLPPYHMSSIAKFDNSSTFGSCLLYLEAITILVLNQASIGGVQQAYTLPLAVANGTYGWDASYVICQKVYNETQPFNFTIDYNVKGSLVGDNKEVLMSISQPFKLMLGFVFNSGFTLVSAEVQNLKIEKGANSWIKESGTVSGPSNNVLSTNIRGYYGYNYACSGTPALLFQNQFTTDSGKNDTSIIVGIILNNFQIQGVGVNHDSGKTIPYFGSKTADCIPTFNQGTWMGIIVTLILVSVLVFAFLMLNSVQTMDRFDDPKQKQIVINFKE
jgi:hypothetical protein